MLYVHKNISFIVRTNLAPDMELVWIEIKRSKWKPLVIVSIYKPPDFDTAHFINSLNGGFAKIDSEQCSIVLLDNFNIDQLSKNNPNKGLLR